jgi:hypothetical protein
MKASKHDMPGRRLVLGGIAAGAAIPVLSSLGGSATAHAATAAQPAGAAAQRNGTGDLVAGAEQVYNEPLLTPGTELLLPAGIKARPVRDYHTSPRLAGTASAWPYLRAADGSAVDASVVPGHGAPARIAVLSGFTEGWYEIRHANGRADRVTWDASVMPFLWLHGEFGGSNAHPYNLFYTLALRPMSASPCSRATTIR